MIDYKNLKVTLMDTPETNAVNKEIKEVNRKYTASEDSKVVAIVLFILIFFIEFYLLIKKTMDYNTIIEFLSKQSLMIIIFIFADLFLVSVYIVIYTLLTKGKNEELHRLSQLLAVAKINDRIRHEEKIRFLERERLTNEQNNKLNLKEIKTKINNSYNNLQHQIQEVDKAEISKIPYKPPQRK